MGAQAGPTARVQVGVPVHHYQPQLADAVQDRAQRRQFPPVELPGPVERHLGATVVRSAGTVEKATSAANTAAGRAPPVLR